eukprot:2190862-Prymnesium_polylepis.1
MKKLNVKKSSPRARGYRQIREIACSVLAREMAAHMYYFPPPNVKREPTASPVDLPLPPHTRHTAHRRCTLMRNSCRTACTVGQCAGISVPTKARVGKKQISR